MESSVILSVRDGRGTERELAFNYPTRCVIGRGPDCDIRLSGPGVSRRHCALILDPPSIRIQDLGSLNGTFVKEEDIGQRDRHRQAEEVARTESPELSLEIGDEFRVGDTVFHVSVWTPAAEADVELVEV